MIAWPAAWTRIAASWHIGERSGMTVTQSPRSLRARRCHAFELDHDVLQSGRRDPVAQLGRGVARDDQAHRGRKAREQRQVEVVEVLVRDGDPVTVEDIRPA